MNEAHAHDLISKLQALNTELDVVSRMYDNLMAFDDCAVPGDVAAKINEARTQAFKARESLRLKVDRLLGL